MQESCSKIDHISFAGTLTWQLQFRALHLLSINGTVLPCPALPSPALRLLSLFTFACIYANTFGIASTEVKSRLILV